MEKDTSNTIRRAEHFQMILIGEGLVVGGIAGLVIVLYRIVLECAGYWLNVILEFCGKDPFRIAGWFAALFLLAWLTGRLVKYEPMISGTEFRSLKAR